MHAHEVPGSGDFFFVRGNRYSRLDATADFQKLLPHLHADLAGAGEETSYQVATPAGRALDQISVADWIERRVPGGLDSRLGQLLRVAYTTEFGGEIGQQSSLNIVYQLGGSARDKFEIFGISDERFHVRGGNDLLVSVLVRRLRQRIETGHELIAIRRLSDSRLGLTFSGNANPRELTVDQLGPDCSFTTLRPS